jgi:hypothetical protein
MRKLTFLFQEPGMIEAIASDSAGENDTARPTGYADSVVPDLQIDRDARSLHPYAWMCYPLHIAFSWAYHHFILKDGALLSERESTVKAASHDYTQVVLSHALATGA